MHEIFRVSATCFGTAQMSLMQREHNAGLENQLPMENSYLSLSSVCSSFVVDVKYRRYCGTDLENLRLRPFLYYYILYIYIYSRNS